MLSRLKPNRLVLASGAAALLISCGTGAEDWEIPANLDCSPAAMHAEHVRQVGGTFTRGELSSRGVGEESGAPDATGLVGGSFSLWKAAVDSVPFDPPANIVCQVLLFEDEQAAVQFAASLEPTTASLSRASIGWPHEGVQDVEELDADGDRSRVFGLHGEHPIGDQRLLFAFEQVGQYVVAVHAGGPGQTPELTHVMDLLGNIAARAREASD